MPTAVYEYDDGDDYGVPTLRPLDQKTRYRLMYRRYRLPILLATAALALWWFGGRIRMPRTDWSRYAYVSYATDAHSMCNALMIFEALHRLGSKADRVLMFPREWNDQIPDPHDRNSELLHIAKKSYKVKLFPVQLLGVDGAAEPGTLAEPSSWSTSITKLRAFELEQYDRVLHLDSDVTLQHHMDELFSLPSTPIAMPRMYWEDQHRLTSLMMLLEPNADETRNMYDRLQQWRRQPGKLRDSVHEKYDMDLLNDRFGSTAMVLPHRPYALLTSEFRKTDHSGYLGTTNGPPSAQKWDPYAIAKEAKLVHFSDWPLPKPWVMWPIDGLVEIQPICGGDKTKACPERDIWKSFYSDFRRRRKEICRILSVPAPKDWEAYKNSTGAGGPAYKLEEGEKWGYLP